MLCDVLQKNPSLLHIDLSYKASPRVDGGVVQTIAQFCRHLRVLKLADCQLKNPDDLLALCGRKVVACLPVDGEAVRGGDREFLQLSPIIESSPSREGELVSNNTRISLAGKQTTRSLVMKANVSAGSESVLSSSSAESGWEAEAEAQAAFYGANMEASAAQTAHKSSAHNNSDVGEERGEAVGSSDVQVVPSTQEEQDNAKSNLHQEQGAGVERYREEGARGEDSLDEETSEEEEEEEEEEELYDTPLLPLVTEDCSDHFGCMFLETLWLDYVTLDDCVAAELLRNLVHLQDVSLADTNIGNPWRLLDVEKLPHLRRLYRLDIRSTALSDMALTVIPKFHPDLQKLSISSTMLSPTTYASIGRLTGVAELELIGGQFYLNPPETVFSLGITPALQGIGKHLCSLNLTYIAHLEFAVIPNNCPKLEHLDLSHARVVVCQPAPALGAHCPRLTHLNLSHCHINIREGGDPKEHSPTLEDEAVQRMVGQALELEELSLSGLHVSDTTIQAMFPHALHPLALLNMSQCKLTSIAGIEHIWACCPYLDSLDLSSCREIKQAHFKCFQHKCFQERPRLKTEGKLCWR